MVRKLAAILSADVQGYSRLMGEDEEATLHTLMAYREVIATLVQQHRGRVVDSPGDNLLAEFASVVDAVECAVAVQRELHARNSELPVHRRMEFRIGVNLGDVIVSGEQLYGDGVNIAARLESLAEGGGICIAGSVYEQVKTKLALSYTDMGAQAVKNIAERVRVYRVRTAPGVAAPPAVRRTPSAATAWPRGAVVVVALLALFAGGVSVWQLASRLLSSSPGKPSIAVLPFVNMSGDPEQEYFSDGMTEDLITDLAKLAGLFVIARNSVFTYKGKAVKPDQVSRELGVRYMLEGSVRRANDRVRITAQLIDATTGYHMWAERYDRGLQDIFAVQEDIARRITQELALMLTLEEKATMARQYTTNTEAWEYFMRGAALYRRSTKEDNAQARALFEKAISLDPQFARAYANLSATHRQDWNYEWTTDDPAKLRDLEQQAFELAQRSVEVDPLSPYGHVQLAYLYVYRLQHAEAIREAEEAIRLGGDSFADGYAVLAQVLTYGGEPERAVPLMEKALALDPRAPVYYLRQLGQAYYVLGQVEKYEKGDAPQAMAYYRKAEEYLTSAMEVNRNHRQTRLSLAPVYMESGQEPKAQALFAEFPDMRRHITISQRRQQAPYKDQWIRDRYIDALRRAGS
jgi:TolB-like protein/class 3 adenylate cyclase/Tfp pilus assembly protein PilF